MPELPEVESLRRGLVKVLVGKTIKKVKVLAPKQVSGKGNKRFATSAKTRAFEKGLVGEKILGIDRRAKNLIFHFSHGKVMLVHLKMTGQLVYEDNRQQSTDNKQKVTKKVIGGHPMELSESVLPHKHTRVIFELSKGALYYNDTRMFGYLLYYGSAEAFAEENHFEDIGLEPHDKNFTYDYFAENLKRQGGTLKKALMDQGVVTGLGNIYADEVVFEARVKPTRKPKSLKPQELKNLYKAINRIIPAAIKQGGSSVADYFLADGSRGNYARYHKVYGKSGEGCPNCRRLFTTIKLNGRTTVYCPACQQ
ncbi:MAG: bifunctional DNA-formamidopyrimidine glycosylase/DNA-(apurinic or apyrimidinic site) lyase [Patescibacteria group bacterium]